MKPSKVSPKAAKPAPEPARYTLARRAAAELLALDRAVAERGRSALPATVEQLYALGRRLHAAPGLPDHIWRPATTAYSALCGAFDRWAAYEAEGAKKVILVDFKARRRVGGAS